jgi:hypothetical protein
MSANIPVLPFVRRRPAASCRAVVTVVCKLKVCSMSKANTPEIGLIRQMHGDRWHASLFHVWVTRLTQTVLPEHIVCGRETGIIKITILISNTVFKIL